MSVQEGEWDDVDLVIRQFQGMTQAIEFSPKAGGRVGIRIMSWWWNGNFAASRGPPTTRGTIYGLVEVGVGLLPRGGGGSKEMLLRAVDSAAAIGFGGRGESVD